MSTPEQRAREAARAETNQLFSGWGGRVADRLVLWDDESEADFGGWCESAIRDRFTAALASHAQAEVLRVIEEAAGVMCIYCSGDAVGHATGNFTRTPFEWQGNWWHHKRPSAQPFTVCTAERIRALARRYEGETGTGEPKETTDEVRS